MNVQAFLNLTVAAVCAWFFWTACLFAIKGAPFPLLAFKKKRQLADSYPESLGWALSRTARATSSSLRAKLYTP